MSQGGGQIGKRAAPRRWVLPALLAAVAGLVTIAMLVAYYFYYDATIGKEQPIAFSHRLHVTTKKISCLICHPGVIDGPRAGIPALGTCMLCHQHIIIHHPEIERLRRHYAEEEPVEWLRIGGVAEYVYFNHQRHIQRAVDCGYCHGNVAMMDRVVPGPVLGMGFCVECHRAADVTIDCWSCHR